MRERSWLRQARCDQRGNVSVFFVAWCAIFIVVASGVARVASAVVTRSMVQNAADATVLALAATGIKDAVRVSSAHAVTISSHDDTGNRHGVARTVRVTVCRATVCASATAGR